MESQVGSALASAVRAGKLSGLFGCSCWPPSFMGLSDAGAVALLEAVVCMLCQLVHASQSSLVHAPPKALGGYQHVQCWPSCSL